MTLEEVHNLIDAGSLHSRTANVAARIRNRHSSTAP